MSIELHPSWDGLTASFFLVLKDCVPCCNSVDVRRRRDKAAGAAVFLRSREYSEPNHLNRLSSCGDPRYFEWIDRELVCKL